MIGLNGFFIFLAAMYSAQDHKILLSLFRKFDKVSAKGRPDKAQSEHFRTRLSANFHSLRGLLEELYGQRYDVEEIICRIAERLYLNYCERSNELKSLDLDREANPHWLMNQKWAGMMLYVDHFAKDLKGFIKKIPYLEELGINWIHFMPLLKSPEGENDGGYAVSDYRAVDSKYGTMEDIEKIAGQFREKGMLMALDYVMNHTSDEHEWAVKAKSGDEKYQEYFFMFDDRTIPDQFERTMPEVFPNAAPGNFTFDEEAQKWVMTQFHHYQWDLNYYNPEVLIEMLEAAFYLANRGVDILRLDAVPFIWKKLGTACRNEYEAHVILRIFKACFQIVCPGVVFIAEAIVRPHEIMGYFGDGDYYGRECDIAYNATFMALCWEALATGDTTVMRRVMTNIPQKPLGTTWINYLRSHDDIGLGFDDEDLYALGIDASNHRKFIIDYYSGNYPFSMATGAPFAYNPQTGDARISGTLAALSGLEKAMESGLETEIDLAIDRIIMLQSLVLSFGGLPMIYSGGEIGMGNDYSFEQEKDKSYDNRWMHRPKMDWEKAKKRKTKGTVEHKLFSRTQQLINKRKNLAQFADNNNLSWEFSENKHVLSFLRWSHDSPNILVLANYFNGNQFLKQDLLRRVGIDPDKVSDIITGLKPSLYHDLIELGPYQSYWLIAED